MTDGPSLKKRSERKTALSVHHFFLSLLSMTDYENHTNVLLHPSLKNEMLVDRVQHDTVSRVQLNCYTEPYRAEEAPECVQTLNYRSLAVGKTLVYKKKGREESLNETKEDKNRMFSILGERKQP